MTLYWKPNMDCRYSWKQECYGYPPRVEYRLTEHGKRLYGIVYQMTECVGLYPDEMVSGTGAAIACTMYLPRHVSR